MMISSKQLRQIIADILSISIDEIRATKENQFFYEFNMPPTDDEVDEFILLNDCFDDEMKDWLLCKVEHVMILDKVCDDLFIKENDPVNKLHALYAK